MVRMSEVGQCIKALAARSLGYESLPTSPGSQTIMEEGKLHEGVVAQKLVSEGYALEEVPVCISCLQEFSEERNGIHVELVADSLRFIGHLDRRICVNGNWYPLEIKSMGRFTFAKFERLGFEAFPEYSGQEACYLEAEKRPGLYVVKCRDTGEIRRFVVPYQGTSLDGWDELPLLQPFDSVVTRLRQVEQHILAGAVPDYSYDDKSSQCRYCSYRYLCLEQQREIPGVELPDLLEAAALWKEGKQLEAEAETKLEAAKLSFLTYAKEQGMEKFRVGGVSVSYAGKKQRRYLDEAKLRELLPSGVLEQAYKLGKEWDSIIIRTLEERT